MFAPAHSSSSSCSHPPLLTLTSSSLTTLSRTTSPSTLPISKPCATILRNEDYGPMAKTPPLTGYEPNVTVTLLTILRLLLRSSRARMSRQSTTFTTTMRSLPMLRLTTSTSEMRLLCHCVNRRAKLKPVWGKLISGWQKNASLAES